MIETPVFKFALRADLKDHPEFLPTKGEPLASGWDVRSAEDLTIKPFEYVKIPLGIRSFCPEGFWYELKPRSSSFTKKNLHALYGTIDETWGSRLVFAARYFPSIPIKTNYDNDGLSWSEPDWDEFWSLELKIQFGEAIGQIIPVKRQEMIVEDIDNEEFDRLCLKRHAVRHEGGFGSTDRK